MRRRKGARRSWYNKRYSISQMASAAWRGVRYIRGLVNSEMFTKETTGTSNPDSATGAVIALTNVNQGDTESNRTGNSIFVRHIFGRIAFTLHASATEDFIRLIIFQDTQQVGDTLPAMSDVLNTASYLAPLSEATKGRFTILRDMIITLDAVKNKVAVRKIALNMRTHIRFNSTASTDIQKNGIYLGLISGQTTNVPNVVYNLRTSYHDN